jgi:hypothetical protein
VRLKLILIMYFIFCPLVWGEKKLKAIELEQSQAIFSAIGYQEIFFNGMLRELDKGLIKQGVLEEDIPEIKTCFTEQILPGLSNLFAKNMSIMIDAQRLLKGSEIAKTDAIKSFRHEFVAQYDNMHSSGEYEQGNVHASIMNNVAMKIDDKSKRKVVLGFIDWFKQIENEWQSIQIATVGELMPHVLKSLTSCSQKSGYEYQ